MIAPTIAPTWVLPLPLLTLIVLSVNIIIIHSYISWDPPTAVNMSHAMCTNIMFMAIMGIPYKATTCPNGHETIILLIIILTI